MSDTWAWNDPTISDDDSVLRRVPPALTRDVEEGDDGLPLIVPAYFQYDYRREFPTEHGDHEGLSCNVLSRVLECGGTAEQLHSEEMGVVNVPVAAIRPGAGVTYDDDPEEPDHVRRASHALVRLAERITYRRKHPDWHRVRSDFAEEATWAVAPQSHRTDLATGEGAQAEEIHEAPPAS